MPDPGDIKAWFRDDIAKVLMGVSAASRTTRRDRLDADSFHEGFVAALGSIGLVFGVKLDGFLLPDDLQVVQRLLNQFSDSR